MSVPVQVETGLNCSTPPMFEIKTALVVRAGVITHCCKHPVLRRWVKSVFAAMERENIEAIGEKVASTRC